MNVYLLLALAFGAVSGVADVAVPRAAVTVSIRAERPVSDAGRRSPVAGDSCPGDRRPATGVRYVAIAPLTGAISPRAPAVTC